jgi:hypothetical protein
MSIDQRLAIGGNNPPDPIDEALAPYAHILDEAQNWLDGEVVTDEGQMRAVDEIQKSIKQALKDLNAARDMATKPLHEAWKAEIARWKPTQEDLERISKGLAAAQDPFKRQLAAQKEAEKRAAWEAADRARREAEEAARAARASDIEAQREAAHKAALAQAAAEAATSKQRDRVKGMRTVHRYEIEDHRVALHSIVKNDREAVTAFIEAYVAKHHRTVVIDGVRTWEEKVAV